MTFDREPYEPMPIDMTPLVDGIFAIILFLLVISSVVAAIEQDLSVSLPTMGRASIKAPPSRPIVINVRNKGGVPDYRIENQSMSLSAVRGYVSDRRGSNRSQIVSIRGDRNLKWEHMAGVMRVCAEVGITNMLIAYEVTDSGT